MVVVVCGDGVVMLSAGVVFNTVIVECVCSWVMSEGVVVVDVVAV